MFYCSYLNRTIFSKIKVRNSKVFTLLIYLSTIRTYSSTICSILISSKSSRSNTRYCKIVIIIVRINILRIISNILISNYITNFKSMRLISSSCLVKVLLNKKVITTPSKSRLRNLYNCSRKE